MLLKKLLDTVKMPKIAKPLTELQIKNAKPQEKQYKLADGGGLYLLVKPDGAKLWRFDYARPVIKTRNTLSFGIYPETSLLRARSQRDEVKKQLASDIDPSEQKKAEIREAKVAAGNTFEAVALEWLSKQKYAESTHKKALYLLELPILKLGRKPIADILPIEVLDVCRVAEKEGHLEKARKTLNKCAQVFRYGVAISACKSDPTRDLKGALETPERTHHAAITEPGELGQLLGDIDHYSGFFTTVCALKLAPILFTRPGELRALRWEKIDLQAAQWRYTPPKTKKSTGVEMIVPLPQQAIAILTKLHPVTGHTDFVFPSTHTTLKPMSENTINQALRRMGWDSDKVCGHGFRATARTILEEVLEYPADLIEMQLGHKVKDTNGRAYNRTWKLKLRTEMMQAWADYLDSLKL
jgi:integrase